MFIRPDRPATQLVPTRVGRQSDEFRAAEPSDLKRHERRLARGRIRAGADGTGDPLPSAPEAGVIVLVFGDAIARAEIQSLCENLRALLERSDAKVVVCDVGTLVDPDLGAVNALARLQLTARRLGRRILLLHACSELRELLTLMGLRDIVPLCAGLLPLELRGEAKERKQARGVEEEADSDDLPL